MRLLFLLFTASFVISLVALAFLLGQRSVDVSLASLTSNTNSVSCLKDVNNSSDNKEIVPFRLNDHSADKSAKALASVEVSKDSIDTTVIHAIRMGEWTDKDNRIFMSYLSGLDKKERISVLKQMNTAINYQQMKIGSYIPNF